MSARSPSAGSGGPSAAASYDPAALMMMGCAAVLAAALVLFIYTASARSRRGTQRGHTATRAESEARRSEATARHRGGKSAAQSESTGAPPKDKRGKHGNRPHKLKEEDLDMIKQHIGSFCSRMSHYSCDRRCKIYLSEDLSIKKMFTIFQQVNPVSSVTYETYRKIFNEHFNISFGYPQSDTCSTCNENLAKLKCKDAKLNNDSSEDDGLLSRRLDSSSQHELHQRKAEVFYERKRVAKEKAKLILFENNSEDQKESPVTLNNLHRISSHEQHVGEQHPDKIVNEYKEHYRDYHEQKEQASDLSWDHGKHANKSQGHLHHQHVPCGPKESLTDISEYEVKTEEITAGMTSRGMNDKKTKEDNTEREMLIPEFLGRVSSQLQKVSDLSGVTTVDEGTEEKTCVIERVIKSNPEENVVTGTQLSNDTTQNTHQGVFFGHIKDCSKHLSGGLDQKPCQKDIEDHRQIVNDQSQSKQAKGPDKAVDVSVKDEYSSMEINIMEATMDNNEWMNINGLEMNNDFPALSLKDESDYVAAGTGGMSLVDSESVLRSLDGHPSEGVATVKRQSQSVKVNFSLHYVTHSPFQLLAVTGSSKELGYWEKFVPLLRVDGGFWSGSIALPVGYQVEWKFVLVENDKICRWEECNNRYLYTGHDEAINLHKCWGYI
ncbi:uncharacterized protein stbd1 isoform X1 [Scleropages formosus]|uniref:Starch-binding domain-containing protein 1 n=1 Tax=Scleropages formosus TaxID=113540 RepID=A0A8C9TTV4_SCLFO|nr:uncharacterized protein LOC108933880 isoform X1 [Scleropages formosus]